jgi:hypothetical protein
MQFVVGHCWDCAPRNREANHWEREDVYYAIGLVDEHFNSNIVPSEYRSNPHVWPFQQLY